MLHAAILRIDQHKGVHKNAPPQSAIRLLMFSSSGFCVPTLFGVEMRPGKAE